MADIKFTAFVNDVRSTADGKEVWLLKTAETHRREGENAEWETTGRTFRDVRAIRDSGVDLSQFAEGDRVTVEGFEVTIPSEHNGQTYYNLTVWANSVEPAAPAADSKQQARPTRPAAKRPAAARR
jgi:single-stranded DNA-binding protein